MQRQTRNQAAAERKHVSEIGGRLPLLASIVDSSDDAIMGKTLEGVITTWNRAAERIYGYEAAEIIGKPVSLLIHPDRPDEMVGILKKIREGERVEHYETVRLKKDGSTIAVSLSVSPIHDAKGGIIGASSIARDITERKRAEEYARSLIEASLDPLVTISPEGKITDVNEATIKVTGVSREKLIGTDFSDYFTEPEKAREGYQQVFAKGFVTDYPLTIRHREGRLTDVLYNASVYKDARGNVLGVFAAARDVAEQKQAEEALWEKTEELDRFFSTTLDLLCIADTDGYFRRLNPQWSEVLGYSMHELEGQRFLDFVHPDDLEATVQAVAQLDSQERVLNFVNRYRCKDGSYRHLEWRASPRGKLIYAAARDITEQKQASQYARSLIEASLDPLVTISPEGKITDVNEATIKVTGVSREKLIGTDFSDYFTEPEEAREGYQQVFAKGFVTDYPLTIRHREGRLTDVLYNASVYKDARGNVLGVFAAARDVTEQKQTSQYARRLIEASLDPLVTISPEGKITDVNEATIKVTGVSREKLIGTDFSDYFTEPEKAREGYQQVFAKRFVTDYPLTIRHREGRLTDVLYNASVYKDARGNVLGVFAAARDVTAQKSAEAEIAEQRTRELERLAELERFQKLTVGRELKMIELKKEIGELKGMVPPGKASL